MIPKKMLGIRYEFILAILFYLTFCSIAAETNLIENSSTGTNLTGSLIQDEGFTPTALYELKKNDTTPSSILYWDPIEAPNKISLLSVAIEHRHEGNWYIPSMHQKHSIGWNRTFSKGYLNKPTACNIRFVGIGLASTLEKFVKGGSGYLTAHFKSDFITKGQTKTRHYWHGFDKNETNRLYCYYETNLGYGSEFKDTPRTLGIVVYCPLTMDEEVGEFVYRNVLPTGYFCRALAENLVEVHITLRDSSFSSPLPGEVMQSDSDRASASTGNVAVTEITSRVVTAPGAPRREYFRELDLMERYPRLHAVCTVQTFRNNQTGPMLYLFSRYYLMMGWRVIIYDRFGFHQEFLTDILKHPGLHYHPYTVFQLAMPTKYNEQYARKQGWSMKYFYAMEKNWGFTGSSAADTADQDQDKTKTYDMCRLEYAHLDAILYADADELFYCPQANQNVASQRLFQQRIMHEYSSLGVEEMRFVRLPYSGRAPASFPRNHTVRGRVDFTENTMACMQAGYDRKDMLAMLQCWSSASSMDNFPKSADFAGKCPFHYNHWSCDGGRSGGRDAGYDIPRCRCKVALDLSNWFEFKPNLKRCHLLHFNDNKYSFQSRREKHKFDHGDFFTPCPIVPMLEASGDFSKLEWTEDLTPTDHAAQTSHGSTLHTTHSSSLPYHTRRRHHSALFHANPRTAS